MKMKYWQKDDSSNVKSNKVSTACNEDGNDNNDDGADIEENNNSSNTNINTEKNNTCGTTGN